jgi:hypothetical protein
VVVRDPQVLLLAPSRLFDFLVIRTVAVPEIIREPVHFGNRISAAVRRRAKFQ